MFVLYSYSADAQHKGTYLEIEAIEAHEIEADAKLPEQVAMQSSASIYEYTRLSRSQGHAIFIEAQYLIARRFPGFLDHDLHQSTTRILESHYCTSAKTGDIVNRMRGVHADEARLLSLAINHAGIELEQLIRDHAGTPLCFGRRLWRRELDEFTARAIANGEDPA